MLSLPPAAVLDANVLFPATLRDLLLNLSDAGLLTCHWSADIAHGTEVICAVLRGQAAEKTRPPMTAAELLDRLANPSQGLPEAVARLRHDHA